MSDKEFFEELDAIAQKASVEVQELIIKCSVGIARIDFELKLSKEQMDKFGLNEDIMIFVKSTPDVKKTVYLYRGITIEPDCFYLRPKEYHPVSTLRMLQEAIKQDTPKPDIKPIESGEIK